MKKLILIIAIALAPLVTAQAQSQGEWYVGTGDISNVAWTQWAEIGRASCRERV